MCSHFESLTDHVQLNQHFNVSLSLRPSASGVSGVGGAPIPPGVQDVWPTYLATFIRRPLESDSGDDAVPAREVLTGQFGLLPHWAKDETLGRRTFNARSETVAVKPSFRDAWRDGQRCIIPAKALYEPDWRSGKAVPTRITLTDGRPMGIAGLWSWWKSPKGQVVHSFTMLTINADDHSLMNQMHKPGDEKRMVVILEEGRFEEWLTAPVSQCSTLIKAYPAACLSSQAEPVCSGPVIPGLQLGLLDAA